MTMKRLLFSILPILCTALFLWRCGPQSGQETSGEDSVIVNLEESEVNTSLVETEGLLLEAMMSTMMYASLGQIATEKAPSQEVKAFAGELSNSNEEIAAKIVSMFEAIGGSPPEVLGVEHQARLDSLRELPVSEFEQAFVTFVLEEKQDDIERMQSLKVDSKNTVVRGLAAEAETMMQAQVDKAQSIQEESI